MFQKKSTIIIGAGASKEVGLPTGDELKGAIKKLLDIKFDYTGPVGGSVEICKAINDISMLNADFLNVRNKYIENALKISSSINLAASIDNYIEAHKENKHLETVGKLAIVQSILEFERKSKLFFDRNNINNTINFESINTTWYAAFLKLIVENCPLGQLSSRLQGITLIIFNYDRCVEFYLIHALKQYYHITYEDAYSYVSQMNIYHPYGFLGCLPSQSGHSYSGGVHFGEIPTQDLLKNTFKEIKTFSEGTDPQSSEIISIRNSINNSDILVFLGFAYHGQNLALLKQDQEAKEMKAESVFGTCHGISDSDVTIICEDLKDFTRKIQYSVNLRPVFCSDLFHEFWRSLSLN